MRKGVLKAETGQAMGWPPVNYIKRICHVPGKNEAVKGEPQLQRRVLSRETNKLFIGN